MRNVMAKYLKPGMVVVGCPEELGGPMGLYQSHGPHTVAGNTDLYNGSCLLTSTDGVVSGVPAETMFIVVEWGRS